MSLLTTWRSLKERLDQLVLGQPELTERLLIALLADGHLLLEGPPGLAKTRAIRSLAALLDAGFQRLQFTPDLLPADLTGSEVFRPRDGSFHFEPGPLFHEFLLADEINRAPAKVQSALLEAMAERQVTIGRQSYRLPKLFMVMATQNPLEHHGTYPLPEAQLDRFTMLVRVDYPNLETECRILAAARAEALAQTHCASEPVCAPMVDGEQVFEARRATLQLYLAPQLESYIAQIVAATRAPGRFVPAMARAVRYGASPRAAIGLERCSRARAWLHGRDYVSPDDIQELAPDVLRHRVVLDYEAEAGGESVDGLIKSLLLQIPVP